MEEERKRSRQYPSSNLSESVANVKMVWGSLGTGVHDREGLSRGLGAKNFNGSTARKIASMAAFGLLQKTKAGYSVSPLAKRILRPLPGEEKQALRDAFFSVALYRDILAKYEFDGRVPGALGTLLERNFGIVAPAGDLAARVFIASARAADIVDDELRFISGSDEITQEEIVTPETPGFAEAGHVFEEKEESRTGGRSSALETLTNSASSAVCHRPDGLSWVELAKPYARFGAGQALTRREKDRLLDWIHKVVEPWLEFTVDELSEADEP